jgi:intracellular multiplication protein IcmJ
MKKIPVILGLNRKFTNPSRSDTQNSRDLSAEVKQKVFEKDDFTCRGCGFRSQKYQDIHFLNYNYSDTRLENMATMCIFCHQCFNLDMVNEMRSGILIWLPEIKQEDLHNIARAVYVARISQGPIADAARRAFETMMKRREEARNRIGTDDPYILSCVLRDYLTQSHYDRRTQKLEGIRLFPLDRRMIKEADLEFNQFPQILAYWRSKDGAFGGKSPQKWVNIYKAIALAA